MHQGMHCTSTKHLHIFRGSWQCVDGNTMHCSGVITWRMHAYEFMARVCLQGSTGVQANCKHAAAVDTMTLAEKI